MNTPRLTGLIVFFALSLGAAPSKSASVGFATDAKIYLSGIFLPLKEASYPLCASQADVFSRGNDVAIRNALILRVLQSEEAQPGAEKAAGAEAFWFLLVLALLFLGGYLLYQIRKRQALATHNRVLQQQISVLFDSAPCGYHSIDQNGTLVDMNQTLLGWLGYERDEVLHKIKFRDLVIGDSEENAEKLESSSGLSSGKANVTLLKKNGEHLPVILSAVQVGDVGNPKGQLLFSTVNNKRCHDALERIKTLDQELEAFSYSISHDLRAPLRSIDGYGRILQEDYAEKLDDEGKRVLGVVMNNAKRMGKLIDDLLDFGRLGRKAIHYSNLNMTGMVKSIFAELKSQEPSRSIRIEIDELLPGSGDADMLRQVWYNLLENAVKYTGKTENATIEVHSYMTAQNELCYEVKDNGVGFDMQYSDKLFGMFQRLHKMQDFSGTGVGLAIVKRIITRHGGRVWANGSLKGGATFYFTLPTENESK